MSRQGDGSLVLDAGGIDLQLDLVCYDCRGCGARHGETCKLCSGVGFIPTLSGLDILELVQRHTEKREGNK